jgi:hypothetical protein
MGYTYTQIKAMPAQERKDYVARHTAMLKSFELAGAPGPEYYLMHR